MFLMRILCLHFAFRSKLRNLNQMHLIYIFALFLFAKQQKILISANSNEKSPGKNVLVFFCCEVLTWNEKPFDFTLFPNSSFISLSHMGNRIMRIVVESGKLTSDASFSKVFTNAITCIESHWNPYVE